MDLGLGQHVVVITGGGSGIGAAIARACLEENAFVVAVGRRTPEVLRFEEQMQAVADFSFVEAELSDPEQCREAVAFVTDRYGRLDCLVNNAGTNDSIGLETGDPVRFLESLKSNLLHYYAMAHYALPMLKTARGSIVNVSSKVALTGQGNTSGYAAAKGAQLALTREWAAELAPAGVRVNSVLPAEVDTGMYADWLARQGDPEAARARIQARVPLGRRMTDPREIAATVVFLLSSTQSSHTTGQHLVVDGGYSHLDRALT